MRGESCFGQVQSMDVALECVRKWGGFSSREREKHMTDTSIPTYSSMTIISFFKKKHFIQTFSHFV